MNEIPEDMLENLKCSNCKLYLSVSPITLSGSFKRCGRCVPEKGTKIIDGAYESFAKMFLFPCRYKNEGCNDKFSINDMGQHENSCFHLEKCCPESEKKCTWRGKYTFLIKHYEEKHNDLIVKHPCTWKPDITKDNNTTLLMKVHDLVFLINISYSERNTKLIYDLQLLRESNLNENLKFCLEITGENRTFLSVLDLSFTKTIIKINTDMLQPMGSYYNITFKLTLQRKIEECSKCGNVVDVSRSFEEKDSLYCKTCILELTSNKLTSKNMRCPKRSCPFITDNEFSLHKHIIWLCTLAQSSCRDCNELISNSVMNHYSMSHQLLKDPTNKNNSLRLTHRTVNPRLIWTSHIQCNSLALGVRYDNSLLKSHVGKQKKSQIYFYAFDYLFRVEIDFTNIESLGISIVSTIPTSEVKNFKCTLQIITGSKEDIVKHLEKEFTDVSNEDACKNTSRFDWVLNIHYQMSQFKWDLSKQSLQILIHKEIS